MNITNNGSSEKDLIKTPEFLCAIIIPLTLAGIATAIISSYDNLFFCLNFHCFNNLLNYFKVPLGIASLSIPLGALAAAQHRSQQTLHQINLQRAQNNLTGYFTHKENFSELCLKLFNTNIDCDSDVLHEKLFPNASQGNYNLSDTKELGAINHELLFIEQKLAHYLRKDEAISIEREAESLRKTLSSLGVEHSRNELRTTINVVIKVTKAAEYMSQIGSDEESKKALSKAREIQSKSNRILETLSVLRDKRMEEQTQASP